MALVLYLACIGMLIRGIKGWQAVALFSLFAAVIAASHQITPLMLFIAVTALVVLKRTPGWYLPIIILMVISAYALTGARRNTRANFPDLIETFG